jgi:Rrf2 family transcriptional regulator, nitric oxide-sensitive transcriptional repressor
MDILNTEKRMFSHTAEYALRAVVFLAEDPTARYTTQAIAESTKIPPRYLAKVLQQLARRGIVLAQRGLNGGFTLARPPDAITVLEVIQSVDPIQRILVCPLKLDSHRGRLCKVHAHLDQALALIEDSFRQATLADLLEAPGSGPACRVAESR